jgi:hypothetical protein
MMHEIRDQVRGEAQSLGIEIVDVRIRRTELMPDVLHDTYERMNAERFAEAAELRAIGQAQATRIQAEADRAAVELLAAAQRESEIVRGEGDAERNRVFADAFQRDPDFFGFYRSMQAYTRSLAGTDTTLVLTPDSEFFRHFGMQGASPPLQQAQQPIPAPQASDGRPVRSFRRRRRPISRCRCFSSNERAGHCCRSGVHHRGAGLRCGPRQAEGHSGAHGAGVGRGFEDGRFDRRRCRRCYHLAGKADDCVKC